MNKQAIAEEMNPSVEYKPIPGFANYLAGSDGSLWTNPRTGPSRPSSITKWRRMPSSKIKDNPKKDYMEVTLRMPGGGLRYTKVHIVVLETFAGPCPNGMQGCHNDGIPYHNSVSNLRWDVSKGNQLDRYKHGTARLGEAHPSCLFSDEYIKFITGNLPRGTIRAEAKRLGVKCNTLNMLRFRRRRIAKKLASFGINIQAEAK
jgi:hypothetical protein